MGEQSGVINRGYGITPLTADFNNDGSPDVVHINIAGKSKVFISQNRQNNYLKVKLDDTISSIAAKITVTRSDGSIIYRDFISGEGLNSDQSHVQIIGLSQFSANKVTVEYIDGTTVEKIGEFSNEVIRF